ncbi:hypothetical protein A8L34_27000 [Bacillus sp. FJAT-27264]|uniref:PqqD family protein n=1 Tax=Paenibacillus sp. (strain DSM 101736 / FJAT-27264) TaxID=1850362 RepID=UPI000808016D|nr:PqqD family protein [Bacillus sp. FJAT-27264]OBZ16329.1 hypothetical protein A8L34_27000 [Bacillus sp. FJAT-27264]
MKIKSYVRTVDQEGEKVLLDTKRGLFYGIDEIGADIWSGIESGLNIDAIVILLQHKYANVSKQQLYIDVENFITELKRSKLIKVKRL